MKYEDQIELLHNDLHNIIYRYKSEYELNDETIIGAHHARVLCARLGWQSTRHGQSRSALSQPGYYRV